MCQMYQVAGERGMCNEDVMTEGTLLLTSLWLVRRPAENTK